MWKFSTWESGGAAYRVKQRSNSSAKNWRGVSAVIFGYDLYIYTSIHSDNVAQKVLGSISQEIDEKNFDLGI